MNIRRLAAFAVMLPMWPLAIVASVLDDDGEVSSVILCFKEMWKRIYEK